MTLVWQSPVVRLFQADARNIPLPDGSVQACITSPPYYQLRRYQGVDERAIGTEPTVAAYVANLVDCFREVWRVLRQDGILFLNVDDSYAGSGRGGGGPKQHTNSDSESVGRMVSDYDSGNRLGVPERLVLALQADGWTWRDTICWSKKNPMPESVQGWSWQKCRVKLKNGRVPRHGIERGNGHVDESNVGERSDGATWADCPGCPKCAPNDGLVLRRGSWRCTSSFEYLYMLTKGLGYYSDGEAVAEPLARPNEGIRQTPARFGGALKWKEAQKQSRLHSGNEYLGTPTGKRNKRSVWAIPTEPYGGTHYSTFPQALVEPCILASTSEHGCCPRCGASWARVVEHKNMVINRTDWGDRAGNRTASSGTQVSPTETRTLTWRPTCSCLKYGLPLPPVPSLVLDPFCGTGTTCLVAQKLGRRSVGVDLSADYLQQGVARLSAVSLPLLLEST